VRITVEEPGPLVATIRMGSDGLVVMAILADPIAAGVDSVPVWAAPRNGETERENAPHRFIPLMRGLDLDDAVALREK
jgi:hypothetical protein